MTHTLCHPQSKSRAALRASGLGQRQHDKHDQEWPAVHESGPFIKPCSRPYLRSLVADAVPPPLLVLLLPPLCWAAVGG